ncbi:MAG TPA: TetR/AcrR family transcriptional regulator [Bacteroidia bacterium]|jgi:TetR/AcrR family transcriptional repressor of nem operon|nr:TetR/AcrR family transcriptional regulator [Bacteroidia bacterium]
MSKAEITKAYIIEKSAPIFNTKGFAGTSLNDITEATGLTKGAIYGNFEDKNEIALAVYNYNVANMKRRMNEAIDSKELGYDKLFAYTDYYRRTWEKVFERGGCPVLNASVEADDNLPFLKRSVQNTIKGWIKSISDIIELGKEQNQIRKDINSAKYATTIITLIEGGIMMAKINNNHEPLFNALDRIETIIKTELKK